jgi:hypothetical protein
LVVQELRIRILTALPGFAGSERFLVALKFAQGTIKLPEENCAVRSRLTSFGFAGMQEIPTPRVRKLRGYAIDPSLGTALLTMQVNELTYGVDWEKLDPPNGKTGRAYPAGEYLEIVDYDPATGRFYEPVNLDDPYLLAQDGFSPSVSNPQFHQQFVYAVMMTTIKNFEKALGRKILWAENMRAPAAKAGKAAGTGKDKRAEVKFEFVKRLRVYPHALRQANAFYDPHRKALLFGYFEATPANRQLQLPGSIVFTCLSHDIIAHETTHAILDGVHRRYIDATHPDTRAFHEAFADIVALFQHFSFPEVLRHQIAQTRGDLRRQNLLGQLAQQFGQAIGSYGSLRDAIGEFDQTGNWRPHVPDPSAYDNVLECHGRGALLVAAVFDAFLSIYQVRVQKLIRIATGGTGRLPGGELQSDLNDEMAKLAAKVANDVQRICIRALDYCPPFDVTFGDYLRAIITADFDMVVNDRYGYRVAFVEAFRKRGISAHGIKSMALEDLLHPRYPGKPHSDAESKLVQFLRDLKDLVGYLTDREGVYNKTKEVIRGESDLGKIDVYSLIEDQFVHNTDRERFEELSGLKFPGDEAATEKLGLEFAYLTRKSASFAIGNVSLANRVTPDDTIVNHVVMTLIQKRGVRFNVDGRSVTIDEEGFFVPDKTKQEAWGENHIIFRGGCTLIVDLDALQLRYVIKKDIDDRERMIRQFQYEKGMLGEADQTYFDTKTMATLAGPFAFTHSRNASSGEPQ